MHIESHLKLNTLEPNLVKKQLLFFGFAILLALLLLAIGQKQRSKINVTAPSQSAVPLNDASSNATALPTTNKPEDIFEKDSTTKWINTRSAGLTIAQQPGLVGHEPIGTVTFGNLTIDLGETPPLYRCQLQTKTCPLMLGNKHQKRTFEIFAATLFITPASEAIVYPLSVTYPRWPNPSTGIESSGGFVFVEGESPLEKIGVLVPRVIPEKGEATDMFEWQIQIRMNDRMTSANLISKAKLQALGPEFIVLMATHPEKIPAKSFVVWFNFEKDGTVSLLE